MKQRATSSGVTAGATTPPPRGTQATVLKELLMPAIKVSDYLFFLQTYYLGHQLLEKYYTRMQQILPELSAPTIERGGPGFSLGVLIDEALSMNQGTQRLLVARILEQQASPQSTLIPVWDYYLVLNDQQNLHTFLF